MVFISDAPTAIDSENNFPSNSLQVIDWDFSADYLGNSIYDVTFIANQKNGWHIYSKDVVEGGISYPTTFEFSKSNNYVLIDDLEEYGVFENMGQFPEKVFLGDKAMFKQKIKFLDSNFVNLNLSFMACKESCFPPSEIEVNMYLLAQKYVNPASIKTIWNTKFNNTNLATKEFEARMPWIHKSCNETVLQLYINNLHKPLSEVDAMVVDLTSGEVKAKFKAFAKQNDGMVEISKASTNALSEYFKVKQRAEVLALTKTKQEFWESEREKDSKQIEAEGKSVAREIENRTEVLRKEYKKNLCKVYDELDYPQDCNRPPTAPAYYSVNVSATGWNNIDKQVFIATKKRETTTFSYKGKTSTLIYNEWTGIVKDYAQFSRVNMYNIPKEFRSYIKLYGDKGEYTYKLNADIDYQTVVLAWTEGDLYYAFEETTVAGNSMFTLNKVSVQEFKTTIRNSLDHINNMSAEMDFIVNSQKDQKRVNANVKRQQLTNKIRPVVFPCNCGVDGLISEEVTPVLDLDIF